MRQNSYLEFRLFVGKITTLHKCKQTAENRNKSKQIVDNDNKSKQIAEHDNVNKYYSCQFQHKQTADTSNKNVNKQLTNLIMCCSLRSQR